ncbi:MAG: hypothetical protein R2862_05920 [Thermoanaerobaculia bacterium]
MQFVLDFLRARNLLRLTVAAVFCAGAAGVVWWARRSVLTRRGWAILGAAALVYAAIAARLEVPQERLHLVEYGGLALLLRAAFTERNGRLRPAEADRTGRRTASWTALAVASAIGVADELVQGILPNRQYDPRDIGFNVVAAALALAAVEALDRVGRRRTG